MTSMKINLLYSKEGFRYAIFLDSIKKEYRRILSYSANAYRRILDDD